MQLSELKSEAAAFMDENAANRDGWIRRNRYYYEQLVRFLRFNTPTGGCVLEIGRETGRLLDKIEPGPGVGIDLAARMIEIAARN